MGVSVGSRADARALAAPQFEPATRLTDVTGPRWEPPDVEDLLGVGLLGASRVTLAIKRVVDLAVSLALLVLAAPVVLCLVAVIRVESPGPAFFVQERLGRHGQPFRMIKFRTMYMDAATRLEDMRDRNEVSGPVFKIRNDPRVTGVGRWLRRWSLDEVPQVWNVVLGHMSLVGPRPPLREELGGYEPDDHARLLVRPGITCIWQVSGRSDVPFETWMEMDRQYLRDWSLWLDLRLMWRTIWAVVSCRGAY